MIGKPHALMSRQRPREGEADAEPAAALLNRLERATAAIQPPFAAIDLQAFTSNAASMERAASGKPIRLASKSVRCRALEERVLRRAGFSGVLAFTLPELLWLADHGFEDVLLAYPSVDLDALSRLARLTAERPQARFTVIVDCIEHVELIECAGASASAPVGVCLDLDAGWWPLHGGRSASRAKVKIGAQRSPVHTVSQARALAEAIVAHDAVRLIGVMAYESQIAGVGDAPPRRPVRAVAVQALQAASAAELRRRRTAAVEAIAAVTPLQFVNAGGTGSLARTASEPVVTELGAGSGLYGPTLFDAYRAFTPRPAAMFALPVVRKPSREVATVLGGGYVASGPAEPTRLPQPFLPEGLRLDRVEGAGEVQTPLRGVPASSLAVGGRVWFRHAKAGELCERFDTLYAIEGDEVVEELLTYRGEGRCFL